MKPRPITKFHSSASHEDAIPWCRIGGPLVIGHGFIQPIQFHLHIAQTNDILYKFNILLFENLKIFLSNIIFLNK